MARENRIRQQRARFQLDTLGAHNGKSHEESGEVIWIVHYR